MNRGQEYWDRYWLGLAQYISTASKDPSTQTGAVIIRPNNTIAGTGYNGFPQNMPDLPALYQDRNEKYSRIVHCEVNALLFSSGVPEGSTLYTWPFMSCDRCFVQMLQAKIARFVVPTASKEQLGRWGVAFDRVKHYAEEANVQIVEVPREELGLEP